MDHVRPVLQCATGRSGPPALAARAQDARRAIATRLLMGHIMGGGPWGES